MKVVIVQKLARLDALQRDFPGRAERLQQDDPATLAQLKDAALRQREANLRVAAVMSRFDWAVTITTRDDFETPASDTDLVLAVGGDGTVLDVSHSLSGIPLLGVNSDPSRSTGYFSGTTVDDLEATLPCMNDLLVANTNPAMMSRYAVTAGPRTEVHASSGIWISTAAGSTAGIRSAGGTVLPLGGDLVQYLVREPYPLNGARYELVRGVRHIHEGLAVRSLMEGGAVYVDGPYLKIDLPIGTLLEVGEGPRLKIVGMDPMRRER
jgi:NAD+ kinase